jgi:hypothetical protein
MALRISRGLFRLWLVASVLWVGAVGVAKWEAYANDPIAWGAIPIALNFLSPTSGPCGVVTSTGLFDDIPVTPGAGSTIPLRIQTRDCVTHEFPAGTSNEVIKHALKGYIARQAIQSAALLGFVPPAFMLVIGSALIWAFRGFRA